jgi:hypothetical protein
MFEIHLALIIAIVALFFAWNSQGHLPSFRLHWPELAAKSIYAGRIVITKMNDDGTFDDDPTLKQLTLSLDSEGRALISIPREFEPDGEHYDVSLTFERGIGGLRMGFDLEYSGHPEPPSRFITIAVSPGGVDLSREEFTQTPPVFSIFDGSDALIAKLP